MTVASATATPRNSDPSPSWWSLALRLALYLGIAVGAYVIMTPSSGGPETGTTAPGFRLPRLSENGVFDLAQFRGTPVVIEVAATWCKVCEKSAPVLVAAAQAAREKPVQFVAVSMDESDELAREMGRRWKLPYPVVRANRDFVEAYEVSLLPTLILVDAEGRIAEVESGEPTRSRLERWLKSVGAAEKPPILQ